MRYAIPTALLLSLVTAASVASADPTKAQCVDTNEKAQGLRQAKDLEGARAALVVCLAASCPAPVRQDCADRIAEIEKVMPTVVFDVKDASGQAATGVALRVDGRLVSVSLDGSAVPLNPGKHELIFAPSSGPEHTQVLVVKEGEKDRRVAVALPAAGAATGGESPPGGFLGPLSQRQTAVGVAGLGVVGVIVGSVLGVVAKSTYDSAVANDCHGNAAHCNSTGVSQISSAHGQATGSTVAFIAGGVLVAGGAVLWFTARDNVAVAPTADGATIMMGGSF